MSFYAPTSLEIRDVATTAKLRNSHPSARSRLLEKLDRPPTDWDERTFLSVPGTVWTVSSDTCATGRLSAPSNVGYDHHFREFVLRQPRDAAELAAVMSADSEEVFSCYRFDGLRRWTSRSVAAWYEDTEILLGYVDHATEASEDAEAVGSLKEFGAYLRSQEFGSYISNLRAHLESSGQTGRAAPRRFFRR